MKKILIIQTAFIGDVILASSLIEHLHAIIPDTQIDFFLRKGNESLLQTNPHLKNIWIWNKSQGKFKSLIKLLFQVRKEKYDAVLNIQRFFNSGFITAFSGAKYKVGFSANPMSFLFTHKIEHRIPHETMGGHFHEVQRNAQLLTPILENYTIAPVQNLKPKLYFDQSDEKAIKELSLATPYFVLAPASVWYTKQWHESKWRELIEQLQLQGQVVLIGGPTDAEFINKLSPQDNSRILNLVGKLSLRQSALLMKNAKRVFVNDSAPLHLASSVDAKTTAIFCSTIPEFGYFPLSSESVLIQREPRLDCMPCGLHGHKSCPQGHFKCAMDIPVESVLKTII